MRADPLVELAVECAALHGLGEIVLGGGDAAELGGNRLVATYAANALRLERPQQVALRLVAEVSDFFEVGGAAVGQLEPALLRVVGARQGPRFAAEELARDTRRGRAGALDGHERHVLARAGAVNAASHELLVRSRFPDDEYAPVARRQSCDLLAHLLDLRAVSHDLVRLTGHGLDSLLQLDVLAHELPVLADPVDDALEVLRV